MTPEEYVRKGNRQVNGWLRPEAATLILAMAGHQQVTGAVGEIGVHHGKLFILLSLLRRAGEQAVALDLFENQELNIDRSGHGDRAVFERNLKAAGSDGAVTIRTCDSTSLSSKELLEWGRGPFRLFSVDGGHTAEITKSDLTIASESLCYGGLLILDDYFNVGWPGVSEGTNRFLATDPAVVAVGSAHGKMFFSNSDAAGDYRDTMRRVAAAHGWRVSEQQFYGQPHTILRTVSFANRVVRGAKSAVKRVPGARAVAAALR